MKVLQPRRTIQDVVFGPVESRRFGKSLGVNPLPRGARFCNFDCIYCECATAAWPLQWDLRPQFPTAQDTRTALAAFAETFTGSDLDSITIGGNGEPTLSPYLDQIVDVVCEARERDWPQARTVILTNGTTAHQPRVRAALAKLDERVVKFDAGNNWLVEQLNRPIGRLNITELVRRISMLPDIIIQSMFVHGAVDNANETEVSSWIELLARLDPVRVQIYSLDRMPAAAWVRQVPRFELERIAHRVTYSTGILAEVFG
jgi:wyosine [tRNA(Phe)-imidazoG37] synthetase (radical SAM superfamily)